MSEEQPTFKVKDRRLFNPDGTPREIEREETPDQSSSSAATQPAAAASADTAAKPAADATRAAADTATDTGTLSDASEARSATAASEREEDGRSSSDARQEEDLYAGEDVPGADDPASFINFLMSIASNAAAALGMMEHPVTGQRGLDLPLAKHWIDVLGMLRQKTRGNLAPQEQQIFDGLLSDLRMQYVSLTSAAPPTGGPRGFTGRDIIGGK
ncbi:MAG TPA: DUF1844 domain-containing protein [Pyrinomonadaceae bacterium]|jgi:hypothetical protein